MKWLTFANTSGTNRYCHCSENTQNLLSTFKNHKLLTVVIILYSRSLELISSRWNLLSFDWQLLRPYQPSSLLNTMLILNSVSSVQPCSICSSMGGLYLKSTHFFPNVRIPSYIWVIFYCTHMYLFLVCLSTLGHLGPLCIFYLRVSGTINTTWSYLWHADSVSFDSTLCHEIPKPLALFHL